MRRWHLIALALAAMLAFESSAFGAEPATDPASAPQPELTSGTESPFAYTVVFEQPRVWPDSPAETWTVNDEAGGSVCVLPCTMKVGPERHYTLTGEKLDRWSGVWFVDETVIRPVSLPALEAPSLARADGNQRSVLTLAPAGALRFLACSSSLKRAASRS